MKFIQRAATVGAVATTLAAGAVLVAPQAGAAVAQAKYNNACGTGYKVVNSAPVGELGTVFLTYNQATGTNCVVTVRNAPGAPLYMTANLASRNAEPIEDSGYYTTYAGPVYLAARGQCVTWWGFIDTESGGATNTNCGALAAKQS